MGQTTSRLSTSICPNCKYIIKIGSPHSVGECLSIIKTKQTLIVDWQGQLVDHTELKSAYDRLKCLEALEQEFDSTE
jgi:hypothetical protein